MAAAHNNQSILNGRWMARRLLHRGACGEWHDAVSVSAGGEMSLPTEFAPATSSVSHRAILITRQPGSSERVGADAAGLAHRHLIEVTAAEWMSDTTGRRLFVQVTSWEPRGAASQMPTVVAAQWRQMVSAVAAALAHLHALGLAHGAVRLDNIFQQGNLWRLGPSLCNLDLAPEDDLHALAELISVELGSIVTNPLEQPKLTRLAAVCMGNGICAAQIAVHAEEDSSGITGDWRGTLPCSPTVERTPAGLRLSTPSKSHTAFVACAPDRAPRVGAIVPSSQVDQLGDLVRPSAWGQTEIPLPRQTVAIFCVEIAAGVVVIGPHTLVDPPRDWGNLHVQMQPQGVVLRWFWPKDLPCREMHIQVRPDRYPSTGGDSDVKTCHRSEYETMGHYLVPISPRWERAYVRVTRADVPCDDGRNAVYGRAERNSRDRCTWKGARSLPNPVRRMDSRAYWA